MIYVGIDIGSTASKVIVIGEIEGKFVMPTGWSSKETTKLVKNKLKENGIDLCADNVIVGSTGYGRQAVDFSNYVITEITCHGKGGYYLASRNCTVIDIGGQDTKIIKIENGSVSDFLMNDKCSAGTGKFIEIMANRLGVDIDELFELAELGKILPISSLCTVFAESEIINYIGEGKNREDIAAGVIDSVAGKVAQLFAKFANSDYVLLTGGLSHNEFFANSLSKKIKTPVNTCQDGRFAGALGAALIAKQKYKKNK
ncbi:acyl-CoA dehydratase activase [Peptostreptococcus equinus]|uniref:Acyl-CoA dehydratase activase n=1 Tax=Peptostreptococcus equinus TaxID=3003601 RepID=A0ABY7JL16_9FIRM|nr:acyl-CoA dehydratase activase [Peptostreptococcus sp. CBA3647]WAW14007.1 acyl-CoA dehydratase activase [Peptostreptococcus sp. CBA3647]